MNQFRKNIETETNETKAPVNAAADEAIKKATEFTFLDKETLNKALPAIIFCVVIAIVYISLSHFHVKSLKKKKSSISHVLCCQRRYYQGKMASARISLIILQFIKNGKKLLNISR